MVIDNSGAFLLKHLTLRLSHHIIHINEVRVHVGTLLHSYYSVSKKKKAASGHFKDKDYRTAHRYQSPPFWQFRTINARKERKRIENKDAVRIVLSWRMFFEKTTTQRLSMNWTNLIAIHSLSKKIRSSKSVTTSKLDTSNLPLCHSPERKRVRNNEWRCSSLMETTGHLNTNNW